VLRQFSRHKQKITGLHGRDRLNRKKSTNTQKTIRGKSKAIPRSHISRLLANTVSVKGREEGTKGAGKKERGRGNEMTEIIGRCPRSMEIMSGTLCTKSAAKIQNVKAS